MSNSISPAKWALALSLLLLVALAWLKTSTVSRTLTAEWGFYNATNIALLIAAGWAAVDVWRGKEQTKGWVALGIAALLLFAHLSIN